MAKRLQGIPATIFSEMSALAVRTGALNLGQGFPDQDGPDSVVEAAVAALRGGRNQYPPGPGVPELRQAVAAHQARHYGIEPGEPLQVGQAGVSLRLDAVGSDFDGLYWDLWVSRSRGRLVAVAHRSALGGDNDDLVPAVTGAIDKLAT